MADLTRGITYSVTETITNSKLHSLVDDATIANIVNADIDANAGISNSKLADIIDAGKVSGAAIRNLPSLPSSAGLIPYSNIPASSLVSIPNISLIPLTLASWVSGRSFKDLASTPTTIGTFPYQAIVPSLASGGILQWGGGFAMLGKNPSEVLSADNTAFSFNDQNAWSTTSTSYTTVIPSYIKKITGLNTLTVYVYIKKADDGNPTKTAACKVGINSGAVTGETVTTDNDTSYHWKSFTVDLSGLTNGNYYDLNIQIKINNGVGDSALIQTIIGFLGA